MQKMWRGNEVAERGTHHITDPAKEVVGSTRPNEEGKRQLVFGPSWRWTMVVSYSRCLWRKACIVAWENLHSCSSRGSDESNMIDKQSIKKVWIFAVDQKRRRGMGQGDEISYCYRLCYRLHSAVYIRY